MEGDEAEETHKKVAKAASKVFARRRQETGGWAGYPDSHEKTPTETGAEEEAA